MSTKVVFITGPVRMPSDELFDKFYGPKIDQAINEGASFVLSGAIGSDRMALCYLIEKGVSPDKITVYDVAGKDNSSIRVGDKTYQFNHLDSFETFKDRDTAMVDISDEIIGFTFQYATCGVLANLLRFEEKKLGRGLHADEVINIMKINSLEFFWSKEMEENFVNVF